MAKRHDDLLLWTIRKVFLDPLAEFEFVSDEEKLYQCFGYPTREIYKRKILNRFCLEGAWWGADLERVRSSRAIKFNNNGRNFYCYVREDGDIIDIEIRVNAMIDKGVKRKRRVKSYEWFTCTLTRAEYEKLDSNFGPRETCCCKPFHKDDDDDLAYGLGIEGSAEDP